MSTKTTKTVNSSTKATRKPAGTKGASARHVPDAIPAVPALAAAMDSATNKAREAARAANRLVIVGGTPEKPIMQAIDKIMSLPYDPKLADRINGAAEMMQRLALNCLAGNIDPQWANVKFSRELKSTQVQVRRVIKFVCEDHASIEAGAAALRARWDAKQLSAKRCTAPNFSALAALTVEPKARKESAIERMKRILAEIQTIAVQHDLERIAELAAEGLGEAE